MYLENKIISPKATIIDLTDSNVSRIDKNTKNVNSILFNDFVEDNTRSFRKAKDFVNTKDTLLDDNGRVNIKNISTFYGVEGGKLKAGPLDIFDPNTIVVPNRAKNVGKIKHISLGKPYTKEI